MHRIRSLVAPPQNAVARNIDEPFAVWVGAPFLQVEMGRKSTGKMSRAIRKQLAKLSHNTNIGIGGNWRQPASAYVCDLVQPIGLIPRYAHANFFNITPRSKATPSTMGSISPADIGWRSAGGIYVQRWMEFARPKHIEPPRKDGIP